MQNAFVERVNLNQIDRTEDVLVGFRGWARLGYASESLGSKTDALLLSAFAQDGTDLSPRQSLFGSAWASGRYERGAIQQRHPWRRIALLPADVGAQQVLCEPLRHR